MVAPINIQLAKLTPTIKAVFEGKRVIFPNGLIRIQGRKRRSDKEIPRKIDLAQGSRKIIHNNVTGKAIKPHTPPINAPFCQAFIVIPTW